MSVDDPARAVSGVDDERRHPRAAGESSARAWSSLRERIDAAADFGHMQALAREVRAVRERFGAAPDARVLRAALLCAGSDQLLRGPLELALIARGFEPQVHSAPYDRVVPELLDGASSTSRFAPELAIVLHAWQHVPRWPEPGDSLDRVRATAEEVCRWFLEPCRALFERCGSEIVLANFAPPPDRPNGNLGAKLASDRTNFVRRVNVMLGDLAPDFVHLNDVAGIVERRGLDGWQDLVWWYHAKHPLSFEALPVFARNTAAIAAARFGRARKCLVLDLDNTLWGGVVADDGLEGIRLGEGSADGEAYKAFQKYLKELARRGVLLAVCSKNEPAQARLPFERHPECALSLEDFAAFEASWAPKSAGLRAIAERLNLGLEALVFFDDNPAERLEVRAALPQVAVPEVSREPADFLRQLDDGRWFETVGISADDRARAASYRVREAAEGLRQAARTPEEFLRSLDMRARIAPFSPEDVERIAQLTNKTNQFNLTTRRTTRAEVERRAQDPRWLTRSVRLSDRFGDHGLIAVLCARIESDALELETWLMSCRVMERGVERLLLNHLIEVARALSLRWLRGTYVPSERNEPVREHYARLGFKPAQGARDGSPAGATHWELDVAAARPAHVPIEQEG